jgi:hypothetical protein
MEAGLQKLDRNGEGFRRFPERPLARSTDLLGGLDSPVQRRRITAMKWETPAFVEINMSAEIGGYGSDFSDRDPWGPVASSAETPSKSEPASSDAARR